MSMRLQWEPTGLMPEQLLKRQVSKYMDYQVRFAAFRNGTCLMLKDAPNLDELIDLAIQKAKTIRDFRVHHMKDGDYLVFFASPLLVYVGKEEFEDSKAEIMRRIAELKFPDEEMLYGGGGDDRPAVRRDFLVGLYARGKLHGDMYGPKKFDVVNAAEFLPQVIQGKKGSD